MSILSKVPPNEPVLNNVGRPTMSWLYFFQQIQTVTNEGIAADIPLLRTQINAMLLGVADLQQMALWNIAPSIEIPESLPEITQIYAAKEDVLPEIQALPNVKDDVLHEIQTASQVNQLSQRIDDLELWRL